MDKKNPKYTGIVSIPVLTVIISTLCTVALILAFTYLFRINSEIVHGKSVTEAVSFNKEKKSATEQAEKNASETQQPATNPAETLLRPAPADAIEGTEFRIPSGNISCTFNSGVSCTIYKYTFKAPEGCKNAPITFTMNDQQTGANCSLRVNSNTVLEHGKAMKNGLYTCTVSETGTDCWNEKTGAGFVVGSETATYTQQ